MAEVEKEDNREFIVTIDKLKKSIEDLSEAMPSKKSIEDLSEAMPSKKDSNIEEKRERIERDKQSIGYLKTIAAAAGGGAKPAAGKKGGLFGGFGFLAGLGAAGAGIGAFFIGLAGAEAIMTKFGSGDNIKKLLKNVGEGLDSFSTKSMTALAVAMGAGAALGAVPGLSGLGAGMGIAWVGAGIGAFFVGLAAGDAALKWMKTDFGALKKACKGLNDSLGELDAKTLGVVGGLLAAGGGAGLLFSKRKVGTAAIGMGAIGLGISAFFIGLATGDTALKWMKTDFGALKKACKGLNDSLGAMDAKTLGVVGGLLAASGGAGALFSTKKVGKAVIGMGAIGLGIGAFFGGLAVGDLLMTWMDVDGTKLSAMMKNLSEGLSALVADPASLKVLGGLLVGGAAAGALFGPSTVGKAAIGMGAIGLGIGAFFTGIGAGDKALSWMKVDGTSLKKMMKNLSEGLKSFSGPHLTGLTALMAVGGIFGAIPGGMGVAMMGTAAVGMGLIGLGLGAFFAGFAAAGKGAKLLGIDGSTSKTLMVNLAEGLGAFDKLGGSNLLSVAQGLGLLGPAMLAFFGSKGLGGLADVAIEGVKGAYNWIVGGDEDGAKKETMIEKIVRAVEPLNKIDPKGMEAFHKITDSLSTFSGFGYIETFPGQEIVDSLKPLEDLDSKKFAEFNKIIDILDRFSSVVKKFNIFSGKTFKGPQGKEIPWEQAGTNLRIIHEALNPPVKAPEAKPDKIVDNLKGESLWHNKLQKSIEALTAAIAAGGEGDTNVNVNNATAPTTVIGQALVPRNRSPF